MSKINNQSNRLDNINFVQDISSEIAANYSGGVGRLNGPNPDVILYEHRGQRGDSVGVNAATDDGILNIGFLNGRGGGQKLDFNDKTSSVWIRRGTWALYSRNKYRGEVLLVETPGRYNLNANSNDRLTSLKRVR